MVDPSQHIGLIPRVIGQMGLRGDVADEAFSEGLVIITEAAQKFDPSHNVPLANWLGNNIRWGLRNWINKQKPTIEMPLNIEHPRDTLRTCTELKEAVVRAQEILTPEEYQIVMADAIGYNGLEIARAMSIPPVKVNRLKKRAQEKMRNTR